MNLSSLHWYLVVIANLQAMFQPQTDLNEGAESFDGSENNSQKPFHLNNCTCMWIFDSLGGKHKMAMIRAIKKYLYLEAVTKHPLKMQDINPELFESRIKATFPNVPIQRNSTDCGVYVLQYTEMLYNSCPETIFNLLLSRQNLSTWFSHEDIYMKRQTLRSLFLSLQDLYQSYLKLAPNSPPSLDSSHNGSSSPLQMYDFNPSLIE
jgi:Ulp1 family protease